MKGGFGLPLGWDLGSVRVPGRGIGLCGWNFCWYQGREHVGSLTDLPMCSRSEGYGAEAVRI